MDARESKCETIDFLKMLTRMIKAASQRVENGDELQLAAFRVCELELKRGMINAVRGQLRQGKSWADIGSALGITRQAAQQRFGK